MDDPLIGLTIYDTTSKAVVGKDSPVEFVKEGSILLSSDGETGKRVRKSRYNESEDCFPCLPSIPDDKEKVKSIEDRLESSQFDSTTRDELKVASQCSEVNESEQSHTKNFWLMRLFQSSLFDMSIAIGYLFNSKDQDVQSYLGSRLFVSYYCSVGVVQFSFFSCMTFWHCR